MKPIRMFLAILPLSLSVFVAGQNRGSTPPPLATESQSQYQPFNHSKCEKVEFQCAICGKTIYQMVRVQEDYGFDNMLGSDYGNIYSEIPESLKVYVISFSASTPAVCAACTKHYNLIVPSLQVRWDQWWRTTLKENACARNWSEVRRNREAIEAARSAVKKAKQELRWLEHPDERPKPKRTEWDSTISRRAVDSIMLLHFVR
jgi:hypothetical protein